MLATLAAPVAAAWSRVPVLPVYSRDGWDGTRCSIVRYVSVTAGLVSRSNGVLGDMSRGMLK